MEERRKRFPTERIVRIGIMAAVICVLSPIAVPMSGGVPISLATLAIMLTGVLMGPVDGLLATLVYILLGLVGLPVFSSFQAGAAVLFGKSGGFLWGYLPLAFCSGVFSARSPVSEGRAKKTLPMVSGMLLGNVFLYAAGILWFLILTHAGIKLALTACVLPFLPGDAIKMAVVCLLAPSLETALGKMKQKKATV